MRKTTLWIIILFIVLIAVLGFSTYLPGEGERAQISEVTGEGINLEGGNEIPIVKESSSFEFEGYMVGKTEVGTFDSMAVSIVEKDGNIVGLNAIIDASSVNAGKEMLNNHLRSDDFFDVEQYPEIVFESTSLNNGELTGVLEFRGVSKEVSFPVEITEDSISSEFFLDVSPFEFKYVGVNDEVRINFVASR